MKPTSMPVATTDTSRCILLCRYKGVAELLLAKGAAVNAKTGLCLTVLHLAGLNAKRARRECCWLPTPISMPGYTRRDAPASARRTWARRRWPSCCSPTKPTLTQGPIMGDAGTSEKKGHGEIAALTRRPGIDPQDASQCSATRENERNRRSHRAAEEERALSSTAR
jgi:hypothetical protein